MREGLVSLVLLCAWMGAAAQTAPARYGHDGSYALPDARVTPGKADARVTADVSRKPRVVNGVEWNLCAADFRTRPIRALIRNFPKLKRAACAEYGVTRCDGTVEGDHLISIELGGCADCLANLWPQPMGEASVKDHHVEDVLPKLVCAGRLTLGEAQQCIASDWVRCGRKWGHLK